VSNKFRPICHFNYILNRRCLAIVIIIKVLLNCFNIRLILNYLVKKDLTSYFYMYIIIMTIMSHQKPPKTHDAKEAVLRAQHALHPRPESVRDENFQTHEFFDPRDLVQVRYEMLRRHRVEKKTVTEVANTFGTSRQAFYKSTSAFEVQGVSGLLPKKRGPKRAHKCTDEVLDFVEQWQATADAKESVSEAVRNRFGITVNPRSIERALARRKKKRKKKRKKP